MFLNTNILIIIATLSILGAVALFIYYILKREEDFQKKEAQTFTQYDAILQKGHQEASDLLDMTATASARILEEAKSTHEHMEGNLDRILQSIAEKHIRELSNETKLFRKAYEQQLRQFENQLNQNSQQALQTTQEKFTESLEQYTQTVLEKSVASQQLIETKTQTLLEDVENQITEYKQTQLQNIDTKVSRLIQKSYRDVLRKTMPENIHQDLILESLEKAKADTLFDL